MSRAPSTDPAAAPARHPLREIVRSGVDAVLLHPLRNVVTAACVTALLVPYLVGVAIARGVLDQAEDSIDMGADLYVGGEQMGLSVPLPRRTWDDVARVPGVRHVVPRILSPIVLGKERVPAVLVGLPAEDVPAPLAAVRGSLFAPGAGHELVVGSALAERLGLDVGSRVPPFYRSRGGERVATVVGVFRRDASIWQSQLVFTSFETAAQMTDHPDAATDLLVSCEPGTAEHVATALRRLDVGAGAGGPLRLRVTTQADLVLLAPQEIRHREGVYHALFAFALALGVPIVLVTSGIGLAERRQETGLLRALGWRVDEVLLRGAVECVTVATLAAAAALLIAWAWLALAGGWGVAGVFLGGVGVAPALDVPFRLAPMPVLLGVTFSYAIVLIGSVPATWRSATQPPARSMA